MLINHNSPSSTIIKHVSFGLLDEQVAISLYKHLKV